MKFYNASKVGANDSDYYQKSTDSIHIFLNLKKVAEVKSYKEANKIVSKLMEDSPINLHDFRSYLLFKIPT